jgi:hypothetical protein
MAPNAVRCFLKFNYKGHPASFPALGLVFLRRAPCAVCRAPLIYSLLLLSDEFLLCYKNQLRPPTAEHLIKNQSRILGISFSLDINKQIVYY